MAPFQGTVPMTMGPMMPPANEHPIEGRGGMQYGDLLLAEDVVTTWERDAKVTRVVGLNYWKPLLIIRIAQAMQGARHDAGR